MVVTYILDIRHGFGFSAGAIDYFLNIGIAQRPWLLFGVGIMYGVIYFFVFYFLIRKLDLKTPGREDEDENNQATINSSKTKNIEGDKYEQMAHQFLIAIGGKENVKSVDNCATRLRLQIEDITIIDERALKYHGAKGIMKVNKNNLQIIVGTDVEFVADALRQQL